MDIEFWEILTNPYVLGGCTIVGAIVAIASLFPRKQLQNEHALERVVERETKEIIREVDENDMAKKEYEPVKTISRAAMVAPIAYKAAETGGDILKQKIAASLKNTELDQKAVEMAGALSIDALEGVEGGETLIDGIAEAFEKVAQ